MFDTCIAGSLPKPAWLATPNVLWAPWTLSGTPLFEAKDDATFLAIRRQEEAGLDIVSDGEQARQHFVHGFLAEVDGVDFDKKVRMGIRNNRYDADCPTVTAPLKRRRFVHEREARVARAATSRKLKFTLPGPITLIDTLADGYYGDRVKMAFAFAELLNQEALALQADGVDIIQFDEPAFNVYMAEAADWGVKALERGDFTFPLDSVGDDEVGTLTAAFSRMREQLQTTQRQLLETERMATIGGRSLHDPVASSYTSESLVPGPLSSPPMIITPKPGTVMLAVWSCSWFRSRKSRPARSTSRSAIRRRK